MMRLCYAGMLVWLAATTAMADWPMYRHDPARSGATSEPLPAELHLQWTRTLEASTAAWPNEPRLHFDVGYEPVVADGLVVVGSANEASVAAYRLDDGAPVWRYFADGPVRFAPVIGKGHVWFGSDDGLIYCLDAADGRLRWKRRIAPDERPDLRQLGNHRLVSYWPVRGGPVLEGKRLYAAAGIWPTHGVFVAALDADTGAVAWRNDKLGRLENIRLDHNQLATSALSPQGYLVVSGDKLLIPNGRSMPAALDKATGNFLWYVQGYRNGDCRVSATERYALVGQNGVVDLNNGREVGSRWAAAGADAPDAFDAKKFHLFEGPIHPYKLFRGCTWRSSLAGNLAYDLEAGTLSAYDLAAAKTSEYDSKTPAGILKPWRWDPVLAWKLPLAPGSKGESSVLHAGARVYGHAADRLWAVDLQGSAPKIAWQLACAGTPHTLLAAEGRLLVVSRQGTIACYGGTSRQPVAHDLPAPIASPRDAKWQPIVAEVLRAAATSEGYCVLDGLGSGSLIDELLAQSSLRIIAVDPDAERVAAMRQRLAARRLEPGRVEIVAKAPDAVRLPPYLVTLVTSEEALSGRRQVQHMAAWAEVLRPYGGALVGRAGGAALDQVAGLPVQTINGYQVVRRMDPPQGSADWTHECADAGRSYFSHDAAVRPPLAVLWYGDGPGYGFWKEKDYGTGVKPQVVGGRVFAFNITQATLVAYDAYTGLQFWKSKVEPFTRYVSLADGIYVAEGRKLVVLDPANGKMKAEYALTEADEPCAVADVRVDDQVALVATAPTKSRAIGKGLWDSKQLVALDRRSGKVLWRRPAVERFNNHALAMGGGLVFAVDSLSPVDLSVASRHGKLPERAASTLLALDARSGELRWSKSVEHPYKTYTDDNWLGARGNDDWICYDRELNQVVAGKHGQAAAYAADSGLPIWQARLGGQPLILRGATFLTQSGEAFDARTGKSLGKPLVTKRGGCNYAVACEHLLLLRDRSVSYVDLEDRHKQDLYAVRSGCSNSLVAAGGLLNVPNFAVGCVCNYPVQTTFAMFHLPAAAEWLPAER